MFKRIAVLLLSMAPALSAQTTIETISFWDEISNVFPLGKPLTATYGQTFTVPATDNVLQSFSFFLRDLTASNELVFQGYVSRWDTGTNRLTGPLLYSSGTRIGPGPGTGAFTRYDFLTGGLPLVSGEAYIAFLSASGHFDEIPVGQSTTELGFMFLNSYFGGGFWFKNNGNDFSDLSANMWEFFVGGGIDDTAFELKFDEGGPTTVPEPSTVALLGTGMLALLLGIHRRKQR
jgi:hypothetical protein